MGVSVEASLKGSILKGFHNKRSGVQALVGVNGLLGGSWDL